MQWLFPRGSDELLVCAKCLRVLVLDVVTGEDGDIDFPWCESCMDYTSAKRVSLTEGRVSK